MNEQAVNKLIARIRTCYNYSSLFAMEDGFNSVGLTVQTTPKNRVILCTIIDGIATANEVGTDYIFLGSIDQNSEYSERVEQKIIDFISNKAGPAAAITNNAKVWRNGVRMYESTIFVESEDINCIANVISE